MGENSPIASSHPPLGRAPTIIYKGISSLALLFYADNLEEINFLCKLKPSG